MFNLEKDFWRRLCVGSVLDLCRRCFKESDLPRSVPSSAKPLLTCLIILARTTNSSRSTGFAAWQERHKQVARDKTCPHTSFDDRMEIKCQHMIHSELMLSDWQTVRDRNFAFGKLEPERHLNSPLSDLRAAQDECT